MFFENYVTIINCQIEWEKCVCRTAAPALFFVIILEPGILNILTISNLFCANNYIKIKE